MTAKGALSGRLSALATPDDVMAGARKDYIDGLAAPGTQSARDLGLIAWTYDPTHSAATFPVMAASTVYMGRVYIPEAGLTATQVGVGVSVAGAGLTSTAGVAIYSDAGARLALSANSPASFAATGYIELALTSSVDLDQGSYYWLAALVTTGTTRPTIVCTGTAALVLAAGNVRAKRGITVASATFPTSVTISSGTNSFLPYLGVR